MKAIEKLKTIFIMFLTVVMLSSSFSMAFAARAPKGKAKAPAEAQKAASKAPVDDFVVAEDKSGSAADDTQGKVVAPMKAEDGDLPIAADDNAVAAVDGNADEAKAEGGNEAEAEPGSEAETEGDEGEGEDDEEEHEPTDEEIAAQEAAEAARLEKIQKQAAALEEEIEKIGNNRVKIIELLYDDKNQDALFESEMLLEKLVESLLEEKTPKYNEIAKYAKALSSKNRNSSLGNYAQGVAEMNAKKPNYKKALDFFSKAKSAKKPHKDASSAYFSCLLKCYGLYAILAVVAIIGIVVACIVIKKKKQQAAEAAAAGETEDFDPLASSNLQKLLDEGPDGKPEENKDEKTEDKAASLEAATPAAPASPAAQQPVPGAGPEPEGAYNPFARNAAPAAPATTAAPAPATPAAQPATTNVQPTAPATNAASVAETGDQQNAAPVKKVVRVVKKVRVRRDADGNSYVIPDGAQGGGSSYQTSAQMEAELEGIRGMTRMASKPLPPVDTQLDILWGNLSRKAMQGHIGLMARKSDSLSTALGPTTASGVGNSGSFYGGDNKITDIRFGDVSIDLSEEAMKDDLVGKLKMLAITDTELRELFAMKNPAHIPHLIEYVMTKPEPMRLAFVAKELGNYGDPAVVDTLASLLYHEDERVVLAAIQGLESTKSPAAVVPLCPFLRDEVPLFAQAARTALSKFGAVKIMQALKDLPNFTDIKLKEAGIFVLSRMKGDPVEKILKTLLNDESSSVRIQVILAMSFQKNPAYIDTLREFYRIANETEKSMTRKAIVYLNGFNK